MLALRRAAPKNPQNWAWSEVHRISFGISRVLLFGMLRALLEWVWCLFFPRWKVRNRESSSMAKEWLKRRRLWKLGNIFPRTVGRLLVEVEATIPGFSFCGAFVGSSRIFLHSNDETNLLLVNLSSIFSLQVLVFFKICLAVQTRALKNYTAQNTSK